MHCEGVCIRCAVGACEACDYREPCDCRARSHPKGASLTESEKGAALAALVLRVAVDAPLHTDEALESAREELIRALRLGLCPGDAFPLARALISQLNLLLTRGR